MRAARRSRPTNGADLATRPQDVAKESATDVAQDPATDPVGQPQVDQVAAVLSERQPTDYDPQNVRQLTDDLGGLREDGTFAAWANGWTVLLANELSNDQLLNSLTYESGSLT